VEVELLDHWIVNAVATFKVSPFLGAETDIVTLPVFAPVYGSDYRCTVFTTVDQKQNKKEEKRPKTKF